MLEWDWLSVWSAVIGVSGEAATIPHRGWGWPHSHSHIPVGDRVGGWDAGSQLAAGRDSYTSCITTTSLIEQD